MVQYSVLRWAAQYPDLADWTDNIRQLETLARLDLLPGQAAADLTDAYKALRARLSPQRLAGSAQDGRRRPTARRSASGSAALWRELMGD